MVALVNVLNTNATMKYIDVGASRFSCYHFYDYYHGYTQGLKCSSFWVMACFLLRDYNILPKKELHWSLWAMTTFVSTGAGWAFKQLHTHPSRRVV